MPEEYNISIMRPYLFPFPLYLLPLTRVPPRGNAISTYQSAAPASRPRFIAFLVTPCCHIVVTMWSRGDTIVVTMWSRPWHHVFLNPFRFRQFHRALFAEKSPRISPSGRWHGHPARDPDHGLEGHATSLLPASCSMLPAPPPDKPLPLLL
jgi:hypothetical protein